MILVYIIYIYIYIYIYINHTFLLILIRMNWTKTKPETKNCMTCETILEIIKAILEYVKGKMFCFFLTITIETFADARLKAPGLRDPFITLF